MLIFKNVQVIGETEIFRAEVAVENGKITESWGYWTTYLSKGR